MGHPTIYCIEKDPKSSATGGFKGGGVIEGWKPRRCLLRQTTASCEGQQRRVRDNNVV